MTHRTEDPGPGRRLLEAARDYLAHPRCESDLPPAEAAELAALLQRVTPHSSSPPDTPPASLPERERAARAYFDYALSGIIETDAQGRIGRANQAAASITGIDGKILPGRWLDVLQPVDGPAALDRHLQLLHEQGISHAEWDIARPDGRTARIQLASILVGDDHLLHVFDDVTEQRRAATELESARKAAEAANRAKSDFLASVSHEVRTPLNGILGLARLVLASSLDPQQRDYVDKIAQSGRTLLRIINELLDYAKIEAGRMEYERIEFSLDELLGELTALAAQRANDDALEVAFTVAPDAPRALVGDRLRLGQCLTNLLGNALKFTARGRVSLEVSVASRKDGRVELDFVVTDTGIGIAPDALARLFQPFSQAEAGTTRRFGGTGLGLAIAREFALGMGGGLAVKSEPGVGSRFTLHLPFGHTDKPAAESPALQPANDIPDEFRGAHILVAEDNAVNEIVICELLHLAGIRTTVARNGCEALNLLTSADPLPDLVLMDVHMPELDGLEASRRLRASGLTLPVIGCSAGASREEVAACVDAGMNDVLPKPIDEDELWGVLTRWVTPRDIPVPADEDAEQRFRGNRTALATARALFISSHADAAERLHTRLAAGDRPAIAMLAHAVYGSAATIGADRASSLARSIETGALNLPEEDIVALINALGDALGQFAAVHQREDC